MTPAEHQLERLYFEIEACVWAGVSAEQLKRYVAEAWDEACRRHGESGKQVLLPEGLTHMAEPRTREALDAYLLMETALAKRLLADMNFQNERDGRAGDWPAQQDWDELAQSSRETFWRKARVESGLPESPEFKNALVAALSGGAREGCINCGEKDDGGYETEEVGPFCAQCWQCLEERFLPAPPEPTPRAKE